MRAALDLGVGHIVVGIGGSATNDGGVGMAAALGMRFLDVAGNPVAVATQNDVGPDAQSRGLSDAN